MNKSKESLEMCIKEGDFYFGVFLGSYVIIMGAAIKFIRNYFLVISLFVLMYIFTVIITYFYAKSRLSLKEDLRSLE